MTEPTVTETTGVVVTGYTATTCLADDADETWSALLAGRSGIAALPHDFASRYDLPVRIGGTLRMNPADHLTRVEQRRLSVVAQLAVVLGRRLWARSGLAGMDGDRLAVAIGTGLGGGDAMVTAVDALREGGPRKVSPLSVPMIMPNAAAANIAIEIGAKAGVYTPISACSSGTEAVAQGWRLIRSGEADVVLCGGVEGYIHEVPIASFASLRAMSTRNDEPERASRPFDRDRDGFVFGEAGALLVLESERHATARGARVHARVLGAGVTSDAYHIVAPGPDGDGPAKAMRKAIRAAGLSPADIDHVNAHATATNVGDAAEAVAIASVTPDVSVYAPKSALGHSIGAVGALETILTVQTLAHQIVPPTLNYENKDPDIDLDIVAGQPRTQRIDYAVTNSIGFGGHNVALTLGRA